jgi:hypothetical protein
VIHIHKSIIPTPHRLVSRFPDINISHLNINPPRLSSDHSHRRAAIGYTSSPAAPESSMPYAIAIDTMAVQRSAF